MASVLLILHVWVCQVQKNDIMLKLAKTSKKYVTIFGGKRTHFRHFDILNNKPVLTSCPSRSKLLRCEVCNTVCHKLTVWRNGGPAEWSIGPSWLEWRRWCNIAGSNWWLEKTNTVIWKTQTVKNSSFTPTGFMEDKNNIYESVISDHWHRYNHPLQDRNVKL